MHKIHTYASLYTSSITFVIIKYSQSIFFLVIRGERVPPTSEDITEDAEPDFSRDCEFRWQFGIVFTDKAAMINCYDIYMAY